MELAEREKLAKSDESLRSILDAVRHIFRVMRTFSSATESHLGLTAAQLFALQVIARHGPLTVNALAVRTHTHQSSVSVVARRLEEKGLVTRRPSQRDRRQVELAPTTEGANLLERAPAAAQDRLISALDALSDKDRGQLAALLTQVVGELAPSSTAPPMFFEDDAEPLPRD